MNDLISWDNYSDMSEEEDTFTVNENIKKIVSRKYTVYVKDSISESDLNAILVKCNYKDEEIKKCVDEKLNSSRTAKVHEWKTKENWKYQGKKVAAGNNNYKSVNNGNMVSNPGVNGYSQRETDNPGNFSYNKKFKKNLNFGSKNSVQKPLASFNADIASGHNNMPSVNEEEDIDRYFTAALCLSSTETKQASGTDPNVNSTNNNTVNTYTNNNTSITIPLTSPNDSCKDKLTHENRLSSDDIKEFVQEIKKNKDLIQRRRTESLQITNDTLVSMNDIQVTIPDANSSHHQESVDDIQSTKVREETIGENETTSNSSNYESDLHIEYDLSKIPNNFLNANNYNSYFFQSNTKNSRKEPDNKNNINNNINENENYSPNGYVNMKMSMNMTMNMQMFPQGYYNPMFVPNVGMSFPPVFYPMQGMDPRMVYGPYFNNQMYQQPFPFPQQFGTQQPPKNFIPSSNLPTNPSSKTTKKL